jgi:hypothetical protein
VKNADFGGFSVLRFNSAIIVIFISSAVAFGQCDPNWKPGNGMPTIGVSSYVNALTVYNGNMIVGGWFGRAGGVKVNRIARLDSSGWHPFGDGMNNRVTALTIYNGELIAGGLFTKTGSTNVNYIARWDGNSWQPLGTLEAPVNALTVYKGELIAGGDFTKAGGLDVNYIARWDGNSWQPLGGGMSQSYGIKCVNALAVYYGKLIAGGHFKKAGGIDVNNIARWDGGSWKALDSGIGEYRGGGYC